MIAHALADRPVPSLRILLVEDHDDFRSRFAELLASIPDLSCRAAADPGSALRAIEAEHIDVVIMDINLQDRTMPVPMNGIDLTRLIKARAPSTQVLICTVHEDDEKIFSALKAGATGYILKRAPLEELVDAVRLVYQGGSPMTGSIARKVVSSFGVKPLENGERLTDREQQVLDLLSEGLKAKEIANELFVSITTVRSHVRSIYEKLHVQNRVEMLKRTGRAR
ncbi:MAG TPA: response regulator transcription factor [Flavobacteriales bacterium]|jgi:NarL family two-component system response regulator LiaR|nr:response regulator transcription factor [Flavobacteriales bacterium]